MECMHLTWLVSLQILHHSLHRSSLRRPLSFASVIRFLDTALLGTFVLPLAGSVVVVLLQQRRFDAAKVGLIYVAVEWVNIVASYAANVLPSESYRSRSQHSGALLNTRHHASALTSIRQLKKRKCLWPPTWEALSRTKRDPRRWTICLSRQRHLAAATCHAITKIARRFLRHRDPHHLC